MMNRSNLNTYCFLLVACSVFLLAAEAMAAPNYQQHIRPIFQQNCVKCHSAMKKAGELDLSSYAGVLAGGSSGPVVRAGRVQSSLLYQSMAHFEDVEPMPAKAEKIKPKWLMLIAKWIKGGLLEKPFDTIRD